MPKEAITITIDRHIHQWIKDQGGNKSRVVNRILNQVWVKNKKTVAKESPLLLRQRSFEAHWEQVQAELDRMGEEK